MRPDVLWKKMHHGFLSACVLIIAGTPCYADSSLAVKKSLFQETEKVMIEADSQKTRFFAPKLFNEAVSVYQSAEEDYSDQKSIKDINEKLDKSEALFKQAMTVANEGADLLGQAEAARMNAHRVMASKYKPAEWNEAEDTLKRAVAKVEKGDRLEAKMLADKAEGLYNQVERDTVAFSYMVEIREKLRKIESMKAEYYAPKTYQKAAALAKQAEEELAKQPYANEQAKSLIQEAINQADFGLKMSKHIQTLVKEKKTFEDLYLESVIPVETLDKSPEKAPATSSDKTTEKS